MPSISLRKEIFKSSVDSTLSINITGVKPSHIAAVAFVTLVGRRSKRIYPISCLDYHYGSFGDIRVYFLKK